MTKTPDFAKVMQDMMAKFPVDASAFQNAFKTQAAFGEKLSKVALVDSSSAFLSRPNCEGDTTVLDIKD